MIFPSIPDEQVVENILLYDGTRAYVAPREFYESIRREILDVTQVLLADEGYTAEMLCGPEFWSQLSDNERRLAGRCVSHMVRDAVLPLRRLGCRHQYPARYTPQ